MAPKTLNKGKLSAKSKPIKKASAHSSKNTTKTSASSAHGSTQLQAKPHAQHIMPAQVIQKKRDGKQLSEEEIKYFVDGFTKGTVPEYQMAALAMAICFQGMTFDETMLLTKSIVESG